jgi:hypothetical protein
VTTAKRIADAHPNKTVEIVQPPNLLWWGSIRITGRWPRAKGRYSLYLRDDGCIWAVTAHREGCRVWPYFPKPERRGLVLDEHLLDWLRDPLRWFPDLLRDEIPTRTHRPRKRQTS